MEDKKREEDKMEHADTAENTEDCDAAEVKEDAAAVEAEESAGTAEADPDAAEKEEGADQTEAEDGGEAQSVQENGSGAEAGQDGAEGIKKGFFKKNKKKDKKDEEIEKLTDQVKRQMAEFENFRKRTDKEKSQMYEIGAKSIIEKVLPVVDNFERGLAAVPEENKDDAFVDGMNKIYKQMMAMLEEAGVQPIEAVGKEFDPNLHNAVMQTDSEEYESGIVAQELQKGYRYHDSVVRHSMVAVAN